MNIGNKVLQRRQYFTILNVDNVRIDEILKKLASFIDILVSNSMLVYISRFFIINILS